MLHKHKLINVEDKLYINSDKNAEIQVFSQRWYIFSENKFCGNLFGYLYRCWKFTVLLYVDLTQRIHLWYSLQKQPSEVFCKKCVLKTLAKFTGKYPCWSLFLNKVVGLWPLTLLKRRLWHRFFLWILRNC